MSGCESGVRKGLGLRMGDLGDVKLAQDGVTEDAKMDNPCGNGPFREMETECSVPLGNHVTLISAGQFDHNILIS